MVPAAASIIRPISVHKNQPAIFNKYVVMNSLLVVIGNLLLTLYIHTAAYWLMLTLRGLAPRTSFWRDAQFDTIRLNLIKVAARVTEMSPASRSPCRQHTPTRPASPVWRR
jgi:Transposase DDE domain group 1